MKEELKKIREDAELIEEETEGKDRLTREELYTLQAIANVMKRRVDKLIEELAPWE